MARHSLSKSTTEALRILGTSVRAARLRRGWSVQQLAERVGVSHPTIVKVERGDPGVALGTAFEAATLLGVPLYGDLESRDRFSAQKRIELSLLPSSGRSRRIDDDF